MFSIFEIIALEPVAGISFNYNENRYHVIQRVTKHS